jgi:hypothetical protein
MSSVSVRTATTSRKRLVTSSSRTLGTSEARAKPVAAAGGAISTPVAFSSMAKLDRRLAPRRLSARTYG